MLSAGVGLSAFWFMQLNVGLAFFNLLPIPILDGGHIARAIIEGIFSRPIPQKLNEAGVIVGGLILAGLLAWGVLLDVGVIKR